MNMEIILTAIINAWGMYALTAIIVWVLFCAITCVVGVTIIPIGKPLFYGYWYHKLTGVLLYCVVIFLCYYAFTKYPYQIHVG